MFFFFKKSKLYVDAFISEDYSGVYDSIPIDYSVKYFPDWWKSLKAKEFDYDIMNTLKNMKSCIGLIEFYKKGITIPMWSDFALRLNSDKTKWDWKYSDGISKMAYHATEQRLGFKEYYHHFKLESPWLIKSEKNISFMFTPHYYNLQNLNMEFPPGITDFYYQHATNINFLLPLAEDKAFIPVGQPLINIVPLSEKKLVLKKHLVTKTEHDKLYQENLSLSFTKKYLKRVKFKEKNESKCPFGFGSK